MSDKPFETQLLDFLVENPDFLDQHPEVLQQLELTHTSGKGTISLLERQNQTLRQQLDSTKQQFEQLIEVARENDALNRRLHRLTLDLIDADTIDNFMELLLVDLRESFQADAVELKLFSTDELGKAVNEGKPGPLLFEDFMQQGKPRCGALKIEQMHYLFGESAGENGSVAIVPLRHNSTEGILAIGSNDKQRFHPGKDTEFLQRLGDLVSHTLARLEIP